MELFKKEILERFYPTDMRDDKFEEFINIKQGSKRVTEYSLKFVKVSMSSTSLVSNRRD